MVTNGTNQGSPVDSTCSILFLSFSNQMDFSQQNPNSSSPPSGLTRDLRAGTLRVFRVIGDVESRFLPTQNVCLLMSIVDWKIWKDKTWLKPKTSASLVGRWIWLGCFEHLIGHLQTSQNIFGPVQTSVKRPAKCMFQKKWQYPSWPQHGQQRWWLWVPTGNPESPKVWFTITFQIVCPSMVKTPWSLISCIHDLSTILRLRSPMLD